MDNLSVCLDGLEVSSVPGFIATRDLVRAIAKRVAEAFEPEGVVVAVDETAAKEHPQDMLVVFDGAHTAVLPLRYSPKLAQIGRDHHFVVHDNSVSNISRALVTAVQGVLRRWSE